MYCLLFLFTSDHHVGVLRVVVHYAWFPLSRLYGTVHQYYYGFIRGKRVITRNGT